MYDDYCEEHADRNYEYTESSPSGPPRHAIKPEFLNHIDEDKRAPRQGRAPFIGRGDDRPSHETPRCPDCGGPTIPARENPTIYDDGIWVQVGGEWVLETEHEPNSNLPNHETRAFECANPRD